MRQMLVLGMLNDAWLPNQESTDMIRSIVPALRANRLHVDLPLRLLHDRIIPHDR